MKIIHIIHFKLYVRNIKKFENDIFVIQTDKQMKVYYEIKNTLDDKVNLYKVIINHTTKRIQKLLNTFHLNKMKINLLEIRMWSAKLTMNLIYYDVLTNVNKVIFVNNTQRNHTQSKKVGIVKYWNLYN